MTSVFRSNELSITIYMIMLIESEKVVSMPLSFARPVFTMYDKLCPFAESKKKNRKGRDRLLYRSLLSLAVFKLFLLF